jgi:hypothetical protein
VFAFVAAMLAGMVLYELVFGRSDRGGVKTASLASKQDG